MNARLLLLEIMDYDPPPPRDEEAEMNQKNLFVEDDMVKKVPSTGDYWLTPKHQYDAYDKEFHFDFDPCPYPKPKGFNSLEMEWGQSSYVNPPFRKHDGMGFGPTAWVHKSIEENRKGKQVVLLLPTQSYVNLLLEAGAELRSAGRTRWISGNTGEECKSPSPTTLFILRRAR